jgi:hypothetical protein
MKKLISIAILTAAMLAVTVQAQNNSDRFPVTLSDPSKPALVRVNLLNGSISVTTHSGKDIIVEGRGTAGRTGAPEIRDGLRRIDTNSRGLRIEEANNVVTVSNQNFSNGGNIEIQVPVKTNLKLTGLNSGTILVDGVDGEIEVQNTNGNIRLINVSGSVVAHSMNANLFATIREVTPNKPMSFSSMNSSVDVTLPPSTKANLKIRADNGGAWSDFDVQVKPSTPAVVEDSRRVNGRFRIETDNTTSGTINGGGADIELRTFNGNIYLRKAK